MGRSSERIALSWQLSTSSGWGIYGLHLTLNMIRQSTFEPLLVTPPLTSNVLNPLTRRLLRPVLERSERFRAFLEAQGAACACPFPVVHALGNNVARLEAPYSVEGSRNLGLIFFEDVRITARGRASAQRHDVIVAGSSWNADVLRANGIGNVQVVFQGVDQTVFHPGPRSNAFADRFVVFSGGTLEFRKGQDIVVAAFRAFRKRHPEALLLTAWQNYNVVALTPSDHVGHVVGVPDRGPDGAMLITEWLGRNGVPPDATFDVGLLPNEVMGAVVRDADAALFTNRCEGGTNLMAMEAMACGVPTVLSAHTGHRDLIHPDRSYALTEQRTVQAPKSSTCVNDWGESSVDEAVSALEDIYTNRDEARAKGAAAASFMADWTWEKQTGRLLQIVRGVC